MLKKESAVLFVRHAHFVWNELPPLCVRHAQKESVVCFVRHFVRSVEDARNKCFRINLVQLTKADLMKHSITKSDNITKTDNMNTVTSDGEAPPKSDYNPMSRCAPVNYAESSVSEGGSIHGDTTESDEELTPEKPKRRAAVSRHGPSLPRMAAQRKNQ